MNENNKKGFNPVTKIYEASDYKNQDEVSKGLATTHEQFSDSYMADPNNQNRDSKTE